MNYENGTIKNLHYGIIHSNNKNTIDSIGLPYVNKEFVPKKYTLVKSGDLILADTSEDRLDAAKGIEINNSNNDRIVSGLHTLHLREKNSETINGYKTYFAASKSFRNFAKKYCEGIKVFSIKQSLLKYAYFAYPKNKNEQFKIVDILNKVNIKHDLLNAKIEALKNYKKGIQKNIFIMHKNNVFLSLKDIVVFEQKSSISAGDSVEKGKYILYKSGQSNGTLNSYTHDGIYIVANDGGAASFKITRGKFSYTDHCVCFKCETDKDTITLGNFLQMNENKITYIGFTGTGLKNIDKQYLGMIKIPRTNNEKIAPVFIKIEEMINVLNNQSNVLMKIKKQLLNSLFI